jgi:hypothetical protein
MKENNRTAWATTLNVSCRKVNKLDEVQLSLRYDNEETKQERLTKRRNYRRTTVSNPAAQKGACQFKAQNSGALLAFCK